MKKPSLQGPKTNLNVVAILEKANSIRQVGTFSFIIYSFSRENLRCSLLC